MADDTGEIGREAAEAVGFENIKVGGGQTSFWQSMAMANGVALQQAQGTLLLSVLSKATDNVMNTSAEEGVTPMGLSTIIDKLGYNAPPTGMSGKGGGTV